MGGEAQGPTAGRGGTDHRLMDADWAAHGWERLAPGVARRRLPGVDVTVGAVMGAKGLLSVDTGGSLEEGALLARSLRKATGRAATHVVITHAHWDHCLGTPAFPEAAVYGQRGITARLDPKQMAAEAVRYGLAPGRALAATTALVTPAHLVNDIQKLDLGGVTVTLLHLGPAHTDHDLVVIVRGPAIDRTVVFCGDLVEESGEPQAGPDAEPRGWPAALDQLLATGGEHARYVPGHGAVVDAAFVRAQRQVLAAGFGVR